MEDAGLIGALQFEAEYRAWLMRCPIDPATHADRLIDVYAVLLDSPVQPRSKLELRAFVFARLREAVLAASVLHGDAGEALSPAALPPIPVPGRAFLRPRADQPSVRHQERAVRSLPAPAPEIFYLYKRDELSVGKSRRVYASKPVRWKHI
jgi:hypothetical protein